MKKLSIDKVKSLGIMLALSTGLALSGCMKKAVYIPMSEVFYDDNTDGLDDAFEQRASNSADKICDIIYLENCLDIIEEIREIDFSDIKANDFFGTPLTDSRSDIFVVRELLSSYNSLKDSGNEEELFEVKKQLYKHYILLNTFVQDKGDQIVYNFGEGLYKSIILDTCDYEGDQSKVEALANIEIEHGRYIGKATYKSDKGKKSVTSINANSNLHFLISEVDEYDPDKIEDYEVSMFEYDEKQVGELRDMLALFKECLYTDYVLDKNTIKSVSTNVPTGFVKAKK